MASEEELKSEIERLRAENEALKKPARGQVYLKVSRVPCPLSPELTVRPLHRNPLRPRRNNCYHLCCMPTDQIVALLSAERDRLNRAIEALQGPVKRRGRPPKNPSAIITATAMPRRGRSPKSTVASAVPETQPSRHRKGMSAAARKAHSARMKKYWAERKRKEKI